MKTFRQRIKINGKDLYAITDAEDAFAAYFYFLETYGEKNLISDVIWISEEEKMTKQYKMMSYMHKLQLEEELEKINRQ